MRKSFTLIALPFLLIAGPAFGEADLLGTWELNTDCLEIGVIDNVDNDNPYDNGVISHNIEHVVIVWQQQGLYKGYVCGVETPNGILFGTIDKNNVTLTQWDAIAAGKLKGNTIDLISHHALKNPPSAPGTCIGTLTKLSNTLDCAPGPVVPFP